MQTRLEKTAKNGEPLRQRCFEYNIEAVRLKRKVDQLKRSEKRFFTIVTSPIWVPVAAAGSLAAAPFQAVGDSIDVADKTKSEGAGLSSYPGNAIVRVVSNPFKAVAEVGEAMWGKD
uniref:Uncharacterized protein n=1 Tax=Magallana gigas TaxID=29159 RepID=A0A8W8HZM7_MAGGI